MRYHSPGIDTKERFTQADVKAFRDLYQSEIPYFLVLGRKAASKNYHKVISAVESLAKNHSIHLVMIGPDDDEVPLVHPNVTYLGLQPRQVVRGALMSCIGLANMSTSESFGMVLLEAWMAEKPVIISDRCAAFADLAIHEVNALVTDTEFSLEKALTLLLADSSTAQQLGTRGKELAATFDWEIVSMDFVSECEKILEAADS